MYFPHFMFSFFYVCSYNRNVTVVHKPESLALLLLLETWGSVSSTNVGGTLLLVTLSESIDAVKRSNFVYEFTVINRGTIKFSNERSFSIICTLPGPIAS